MVRSIVRTSDERSAIPDSAALGISDNASARRAMRQRYFTSTSQHFTDDLSARDNLGVVVDEFVSGAWASGTPERNLSD